MNTVSNKNKGKNNINAASVTPLNLTMGTPGRYSKMKLHSFKRMTQLKSPIVKLVTGSPYIERYNQPAEYWERAISPRSFASHMSLLTTTLIDLRIVSSPNDWHSHDGSQLDLSSVQQLTKLPVPWDCYSTIGSPRGIWELLPPSLLTLETVLLRDYSGWSPNALIALEQQRA